MSQTENLERLFSTRLFRIPDYQRGFAWGEKQLSDLWDDLDEIKQENGELKEHYTGTIFLEEQPSSDNKQWLNSKTSLIVDGQQRLTAISILLFEMLKATEEGYCDQKKEKLFERYITEKKSNGTSEVYKFGYLPANQNHRYLLKDIFENDKTVSELNIQNLYTENLKFAKEFFHDKIQCLTPEQKDLLFRKIVRALLFDIRLIEKDIDVQAVFETLNNRGKPLTTLEKLKNRLIYLSEKLDVDPTVKIRLRDDINTAWGTIYSSLAQNPRKVLDEDEFLSAHLSLYKDPPQGYVFSENAADEKVFKMFCNKPEKYGEAAITYGEIEKYIVSISKLAPVWYSIHNSSVILVKKLLLLNGTKEVKILLASLFAKNKPEELEAVLKLLEKAFFRNTVPGLYFMPIEYDSANKAREIYRGESGIDKLSEYITEKMKNPVDVQSMIKGFGNLFSYITGNKGFHRWGALKYFLFAYEEKLKEEFKEHNDKVSLDEFSSTQIEHIMPQSWSAFWQAEMDEFLCSMTEEQKGQAAKVILNTLGNLTILGPKNLPLGNGPWNTKKDWFTSGSYNEIEVSKYSQWNYKSIKKRGENMLKFLCEKVQDGLVLDQAAIQQILFDTDYIIKVVYKDS